MQELKKNYLKKENLKVSHILQKSVIFTAFVFCAKEMVDVCFSISFISIWRRFIEFNSWR